MFYIGYCLFGYKGVVFFMIYNGNIGDKTDFKSEKAFYVNSCGITHTNDVYSVIREFGRNDFHILYVKEGNCYIEKDRSKITLKENDIFIYYPHERQMYSFDGKDNISYWIHFSGYEVENLLTELNLTAGIHHLDEYNNISILFDKIQKEYSTYSVISNNSNYNAKISRIKNSGLLIELLSNICLSINRIDNREISLKFTDSVNRFPENDFDIDHYAQSENLSRSRYNYLFKEETRLSPRQYLINSRIAKSKWLLKHSSLNIAQISEKVGYTDPLYFSRVFKKKTGDSPLNYLKKFKTNNLDSLSDKDTTLKK